jgi:hypothetical protein
MSLLKKACRGPLPRGHGSVTDTILSRAREQAFLDFFIKLTNGYSTRAGGNASQTLSVYSKSLLKI